MSSVIIPFSYLKLVLDSLVQLKQAEFCLFLTYKLYCAGRKLKVLGFNFLLVSDKVGFRFPRAFEADQM